MLNRKEFIEEQKFCAKNLNMSLKEYISKVDNIKIPKKSKSKNREYDNSILSKLGLTDEDLKRKKLS